MKLIKLKPKEYMSFDGREVVSIICKATADDILTTYRRTNKNRGEISLYQMNMNNEVVGYYKSITEAAKTTGANISSISKVLRGEMKTTHGYKWKKHKT